MKMLSETIIFSNALLTTAISAQSLPEFDIKSIKTPKIDYIFSNIKDIGENASSRIIEQKIPSEDFIEEWTSKNEKRLDELVTLIHTGKATSEDRAEMSLLRKIRRQKKSKRTAGEMIAQIEKENARVNLKQALLKYVEIIGENKKV